MEDVSLTLLFLEATFVGLYLTAVYRKRHGIETTAEAIAFHKVRYRSHGIVPVYVVTYRYTVNSETYECTVKECMQKRTLESDRLYTVYVNRHDSEHIVTESTLMTWRTMVVVVLVCFIASVLCGMR